MITTGTDEHGKPICKLLSPKAYFPTYNDAYQALMVYNREGYNPSRDTTFKMLYDEWSQKYYKDVSAQAVAAHSAAWQYLSPIYDSKVCDVKIKQLREVVETASKMAGGKSREASSNTKKNMKILLNLLYDYAVENEITDKNYARSFNLSKNISKEAAKAEKEHIPFSVNERKILWQHKDDDYIDMILINCFTGFRPYELLQIRIADVDLDNWTITGGMKTDAGYNRIVPIHTAIRSFVKDRYETSSKLGSEYLFIDPDKHRPFTRDRYRWRFDRVVKLLGLNPNHRPHDPRKDFVTMAKKANVDEYAIKRIVGHAIKDITEKVYTERDIEWLHQEIEKIIVE